MRYAQLKAFHAVALHGGFSKAAERLSLTQPAVSDHIAKLEDSCGAQLFLRTRREAVLTDLGRQLFALTERMFETESQIVELLSRARKLEQGNLTIGADAAVHVLPLIKRFRDRYPGVTVKLLGGNSNELLGRLDHFDIDFAVASLQPADARYATRLLREDRLVAIVAKSHALAKARRIALSTLAKYPIILREQGSMTRTLFLEEAGRCKMTLASVTEIDSREAVSEAVAQGLGIGIVSAGEIVPDARLRTLAFSDWDVTMREWLIWLKQRAELHLLKAFLNLVGER